MLKRTLPSAELKLGVVILAAGSSKRMGQPKLLLPWQKSSVLGYVLQTWICLGAQQIAVVWSAAEPGIFQELNRLQHSPPAKPLLSTSGAPNGFAIENPDPEGEMWSSIQSAARWAGWDSTVSHFAIVLGDQPHVSETTLKSFVDQLDPNPTKIWQPMVRQKRCHPVVLPRAVFDQIPESPGPTLRDFLEAHSQAVQLVPMDDLALSRDIDTPADYEELSS